MMRTFLSDTDLGPVVGFLCLGKGGEPKRIAPGRIFAAACRAEPELVRYGLYLSAYTYPATEFTDHLHHLGRRDWQGPCGTFLVRFDVDARGDQSRALADARTLFSYLVDHFGLAEDEVIIGFSGSKGYHLELVVGPISPGDLIPSATKQFCQNISETLELATFDGSVYDRTRLWRLWNSRHEKTGFYKRRLMIDELFRPGVSHAELSRKPRPFEPPGPIRSDQFDRDWAAAASAVTVGRRPVNTSPDQQTDVPSCRHVHNPLTDRAADFLWGKVLKDRHLALFHTMAVLAGAGCPQVLAFDLIRRAVEDCGLINDYGWKEVLRTARDGWKRGITELETRLLENKIHENFD
jgi:hypothetical protein